MDSQGGHRRRSISLAALLVVGITLVAAPAASGVEPDIIAAGTACSFDVMAQAVPKLRGDHPHVGAADITLTNMDTGISIVSKSRYLTTETFDPATNTVIARFIGSRVHQFYPGDQGPRGVVGEPGALLRIDGFVQATFDLDTEFITAFTFRGHVTDLCALLAR